MIRNRLVMAKIRNLKALKSIVKLQGLSRMLRPRRTFLNKIMVCLINIMYYMYYYHIIYLPHIALCMYDFVYNCL